MNTDHILGLRLRLLELGYIPLPVTHPDAPMKYAGKAPQLPAWQTIRVTPDVIRSWAVGKYRLDTNTGCRGGDVLGIDIDIRTPELALQAKALVETKLPPSPLVRVGQEPKRLLLYRADGETTKIATPKFVMPDGTEAQVEFLAHGQQFLLYGMHPGTRKPYAWIGYSHPLEMPADALPTVNVEQLGEIRDALTALLHGAGGVPKVSGTSAPRRDRTPRPASSWPPPTREEVCDALKATPNNVDWHWWVKIGAALYDALADDGEQLFLDWSAQSSVNDPEFTRRKWRSYRSSPMDTAAASLFWLARQNGWKREGEGQSDPRRSETARTAFRLLRFGICGFDVLARLHAENDQRPEPLPADAVNATALWCARQLKEEYRDAA